MSKKYVFDIYGSIENLNREGTDPDYPYYIEPIWYEGIIARNKVEAKNKANITFAKDIEKGFHHKEDKLILDEFVKKEVA